MSDVSDEDHDPKTGSARAVLDIIFVHGLGGDNTGTWDADGDSFWPDWIAEDFPQCRVRQRGYDSNVFARFLTGKGASIQDLAGMLADDLVNRPDPAPHVLFVTHSLGGLVVKGMLRKCHDSGNSDWNELGRQTAGIAFLGTPHVGSRLADALDLLLRRFKSTTSKQLTYAAPGLIELNEFFRTWAFNQGVEVRSYYETKDTNGFRIVDEVAANPNVHGSDPVGVEADHIGVCKPTSREDRVYRSIASLIEKVLSKIEKARTRSLATTGSSNALVPFGDKAVPTTGADLVEVPSFEPVIRLGLDAPKVPAAPTPAASTDVAEAPLSGELLVDYQFYTTKSEDDRRDLAAKLEASGRDYAIREAERKKERFSMALRRHIAQPAAVRRYTRLMADVETRFNRHVARAVADDLDPATVDHIVEDCVVTPCTEIHSSKDEEISAALVESALYYLAGNCHLAWDNG